MTTGKLEVTIKINELPNDVQTNKDNCKIFQLDCDGRVVSVTVKPKIWKKLEDAAANYPQWVAAIGGKMGESTPNGFVLSEPNIQVLCYTNAKLRYIAQRKLCPMIRLNCQARVHPE